MNEHPEGYIVKLVRDRVGDMLGGEGRVFYQPMPEAERLPRLRAKLVEEAVEYLTNPSTSELADVLEVVVALAECDLKLPMGLQMVREVAERKREERGGFQRGMGMYAIRPADVPEFRRA